MKHSQAVAAQTATAGAAAAQSNDRQAGSHAPLDSIVAELEAIKSRNNAQRARAEAMASERMALEAAARQAGARVAELEALQEARLGSMPPGQRAAYQVSKACQYCMRRALTMRSRPATGWMGFPRFAARAAACHDTAWVPNMRPPARRPPTGAAAGARGAAGRGGRQGGGVGRAGGGGGGGRGRAGAQYGQAAGAAAAGAWGLPNGRLRCAASSGRPQAHGIAAASTAMC